LAGEGPAPRAQVRWHHDTCSQHSRSQESRRIPERTTCAARTGLFSVKMLSENDEPSFAEGVVIPHDGRVHEISLPLEP
jgi:hypothetical protein